MLILIELILGFQFQVVDGMNSLWIVGAVMLSFHKSCIDLKGPYMPDNIIQYNGAAQ